MMPLDQVCGDQWHKRCCGADVADGGSTDSCRWTVTWVSGEETVTTLRALLRAWRAGFDPLGYMSAALMALCSVPSDRRVIVVTDMDGAPDPLAVDALRVVAKLSARMWCKFLSGLRGLPMRHSPPLLPRLQPPLI